MPGVGVSFEFEPISKKKTLEKLDKKTIKEPLSKSISKITRWLDGMVEQSTPVDTGRLRASITSQVSGETGKVGTNVEYASFVEYGTSKMEARYVTPGTFQRVKGKKGPFAYSMEQLQEKLGDFLKELGEAIKVRFG